MVVSSVAFHHGDVHIVLISRLKPLRGEVDDEDSAIAQGAKAERGLIKLALC